MENKQISLKKAVLDVLLAFKDFEASSHGLIDVDEAYEKLKDCMKKLQGEL